MKTTQSSKQQQTHIPKNRRRDQEKKQTMSIMSLNLACFQNENHGCHDVAPIKQNTVSHTDPKWQREGFYGFQN